MKLARFQKFVGMSAAEAGKIIEINPEFVRSITEGSGPEITTITFGDGTYIHVAENRDMASILLRDRMKEEGPSP